MKALDDRTLGLVRAAAGATSVEPGEVLQPLWSGFGRVQRVTLRGAPHESAILKLIDTSAGGRHPRGWDTDASRERKRRSYAVEATWYERHAARCDARCRVPVPLGAFEDRSGGRNVRGLLLEDLDTRYPRRRDVLTVDECRPCLEWLAAFHARFLDDAGTGLWPTGCYWHLATRPDELAAMPESALRKAAPALDRALAGARHRTLVHGDAKLANFCFEPDARAVAAVDFQYVGVGPGIRDVVYFLGGALTDADCRHHETWLLDTYFTALGGALEREGHGARRDAIEREWRALYAVAWADFLRFLVGWVPTHPKVSPYARELAGRALDALGETRDEGVDQEPGDGSSEAK